MAADYKSMYMKLVHSVNDAITALDHGGAAHADLAGRILRKGLLTAEEIYIQTDDTEEQA